MNSEEWLSSNPSLLSSSLITSMMCWGTVLSLSLSLNFSSMASLSSFSRPSSWKATATKHFLNACNFTCCWEQGSHEGWERVLLTERQSLFYLLNDLELLLQQVLPVGLFDLFFHLWVEQGDRCGGVSKAVAGYSTYMFGDDLWPLGPVAAVVYWAQTPSSAETELCRDVSGSAETHSNQVKRPVPSLYTVQLEWKIQNITT